MKRPTRKNLTTLRARLEDTLQFGDAGRMIEVLNLIARLNCKIERMT